MTRRPSSTRVRRQCFEYWRTPDNKLICYRAGCGRVLDPVRDAWEAEHEIPRELGGSDEPPNVKPCCIPCHRQKTREEDRPQIDKARRRRNKHLGIKKRGGKFKGWRKFSGEIVWANKR